MGKEVTKMYALFPRKKTYGLAQSFAWADAMLCVDTCKALRGHLQSFALAHAMLCDGTCNSIASKVEEVNHLKSFVAPTYIYYKTQL